MLVAGPAAAVEVLGVHLFGEKQGGQTGDVRYSVNLIVEGGDKSLQAILSNSLSLVAGSKNGAADVYALIARARADADVLKAALYTEARYGGSFEIHVDGQPVKEARAEEIIVGNDTVIPVEIRVLPGPVFRFGEVLIDQTRTTQNTPGTSPDDYKLIQGQPARSDLIVSAIDRIIEDWRNSGYPFALVAAKDISADHARQAVDIHITIDPGAPAVYGWISVAGAKDLDNRTITDQSGLTPGKRFDTEDLRNARERLRKFESIESVRIVEGDGVDADGGIPVTLKVRERKLRYIGGTASVSTLDGAELNVYWGHRNLFGQGELLKVDAGVSRLGSEALEDLEFDATAVFEKPGIYDIDTDFFAEARIARDNPDPYDAYTAGLKTGIRRRFNETTTGSIAIQAEHSRIEDAFGKKDHSLFSMPAKLTYDSRDNRLNPSRGLHADGRVAPVIDLAEGTAFVTTQFQVANYRAVDAEQKVILAGRVGAGSIVGETLFDVPASYRFFGGGSGSVRGYEYRSLGPTIDGQLAGGLSFVSASIELRLRPFQQFGIVPFVDVATISEEAWPTFSDVTYVGGGIGIRYFTSLGPVRLDFAVPLTERDGLSDFAFYVGLGQAF